MQVLNRKLVRDLVRLWAQSLAIGAVLACGVMILVMAYGTQRSLSETRDTYYERARFAEVWSSAERAPVSLTTQIAAIEGVSRVEARISRFAALDLPDLPEPATGQLLSIPAAGQPLMNIPTVTRGRMPGQGRADEVMVNDTFAAAHGFAPGDRFAVTLNGQKREVTITGTALSPEFIYTIGPGSIMPDDLRFGVLWMSEDVLAAAYGLSGAFNSVTLGLTHGTDPEPVMDRLEALLEPYGGTGAYRRIHQTSHAFLQGELDQLEVMANVVPPIFLVISAFLVNMVLGRLIALEREQIGLLKALGFGNVQIAWHYLKLALLIGVVGVVIGWAAGLLLSKAMAQVYVEFFHFPYLVFVTYPETYAISGLAGLGAAMIGALGAVRRVVRLRPAVAMSPPAPTRFRRGIFDRLIGLLRPRQPTMMILRSLGRWPLRAALTSFGIAVSGAMVVAGLFMFDSFDELIDVAFFQANRQDAVVEFALPRPEAALDLVEALPGVMKAEGTLIVPARLVNGHRERTLAIEGRRAGADLSRVFDGETHAPVLPEHGIVLARRLAGQLGVSVGDSLSVEFLQADRTAEIVVTGLVRQYFGIGAYMDLAQVSALLGTAPQVSQADVMLDPQEEDAFFAAVKDAPAVAGVTLMTEVRRTFDQTIAESAGISMTIYAFIASLIAVGVVYNSARIQLSERARELASLRILGFTRGEVSYILLGELFVLVAVAIPLGMVLGRLIGLGMVTSFESDLYAIPLVISEKTYLRSAAIVAGASVASALIVRRRIDRMDLVSVMKTRE